jgi:hypothetical protein
MPLSVSAWPNSPALLKIEPHGVAWQSDGNGALSGFTAKLQQRYAISPRRNTGRAASSFIIIEINGVRAASTRLL